MSLERENASSPSFKIVHMSLLKRSDKECPKNEIVWHMITIV